MSLGSVIIKMYRLVSKKWRPYCWLNDEYDLNQPCNVYNMEIWCCEECPFSPKNFSKKVIK